MPIFGRDSGELKETDPFGRVAGELVNIGAAYAMVGSTLTQVYPNANTSGVLPPTNVAVTAGPDHDSVTIGWTNQTPDTTPTHTQYRIAQLGAVWLESDYGVTSALWSALDANTEYTAQVRHVVRTNGVVTATSSIASVTFTTTAAPVGAPAEDPGSPGGTSTNFDIGIGGGTTGVGTPGGCWYEWKLQIVENTGYTGVWSDTGTTGTASGLTGIFTYDTASLDNTRVYRIAARLACDDVGNDGVADTWGDWEYGPSFAGDFDWGASCGNIPAAPIIGSAPGTLAWAMPQYCSVNIGNVESGWIDQVSGIQIMKGPHYRIMYVDEDGEWGGMQDTTDGGVTFAAALPAIESAVDIGNDFTTAHRFRFPSGYSLTNGKTTRIATFGAGNFVLSIKETASAWYPSISFYTAGGLVTLEDAASAVALDTAKHTVTFRFDADGTKDLWLDRNQHDTNTDNDDLPAGFDANPHYYVGGPDSFITFQQLGWAALLSDSDIQSLTPLGVLDDFERADEALADSPNWTSVTTGLEIVSGEVEGVTGVSYWVGDQDWPREAEYVGYFAANQDPAQINWTKSTADAVPENWATLSGGTLSLRVDGSSGVATAAVATPATDFTIKVRTNLIDTVDGYFEVYVDDVLEITHTETPAWIDRGAVFGLRGAASVAGIQAVDANPYLAHMYLNGETSSTGGGTTTFAFSGLDNYVSEIPADTFLICAIDGKANGGDSLGNFILDNYLGLTWTERMALSQAGNNRKTRVYTAYTASAIAAGSVNGDVTDDGDGWENVALGLWGVPGNHTVGVTDTAQSSSTSAIALDLTGIGSESKTIVVSGGNLSGTTGAAGLTKSVRHEGGSNTAVQLFSHTAGVSAPNFTDTTPIEKRLLAMELIPA